MEPDDTEWSSYSQLFAPGWSAQDLANHFPQAPMNAFDLSSNIIFNSFSLSPPATFQDFPAVYPKQLSDTLLLGPPTAGFQQTDDGPLAGTSSLSQPDNAFSTVHNAGQAPLEGNASASGSTPRKRKLRPHLRGVRACAGCKRLKVGNSVWGLRSSLENKDVTDALLWRRALSAVYQCE